MPIQGMKLRPPKNCCHKYFIQNSFRGRQSHAFCLQSLLELVCLVFTLVTTYSAKATSLPVPAMNGSLVHFTFPSLGLSGHLQTLKAFLLKVDLKCPTFSLLDLLARSLWPSQNLSPSHHRMCPVGSVFSQKMKMFSSGIQLVYSRTLNIYCSPSRLPDTFWWKHLLNFC